MGSSWQMLVLTGWFALGTLTIFFDGRRPARALADLAELEPMLAVARKAKTATDRQEMRKKVDRWAQPLAGSPVARWVTLVGNAHEHGGVIDATALRTAFEADEATRYGASRFFVSQILRVGLFCTAAALFDTLRAAGQIQDMMAHMGHAFRFTALGIFFSVFLPAIWRLWLGTAHDHYKRRMADVLLGDLAPLYSHPHEASPQALCLAMIETTRDAMVDMCDQYGELSAKAAEQIAESQALQASVLTSTEASTRAFGEVVEGHLSPAAARLSKAARSLHRTHERFAGALDQGLGALSAATQDLALEAQAIHREQAAAREVIAEGHQAIVAAHGALTTRFGEHHQLGQRLLLNIDEAARGFSEAAVALDGAARASTQACQGVASIVGASLDESLRRQEDILSDINRAMGRRWDDLLIGTVAAREKR